MIQPITAEQIIDSDLLEAYAQECAVTFLGAIKPDRALYRAMEEGLILKCFGVFQEERMTGFATVLTTVYPHYSRKVATVESLYVIGAGGTELMAEVKRYAQESKCAAIFYSAPVGGRLEKLLTAKKVQRTSAVFGEPL